MTAEVGVMNRLGVALAADSAVTLGGGKGKIYTSADKLFQLSHTAPIGLMVYGNANLAGIPWETTVKTYRKELGGKTFDQTEQYAEDLIAFIKKRADIFSHTVAIEEAKEFVTRLFLGMRDEIWRRLKQKESEGSKITEGDVRTTSGQVIRANLDRVREKKRIARLPGDIRRKLRKTLRTELKAIKGHVFRDLPMTAIASRDLSTAAIELLTRSIMSPNTSGMVVAGFGEKEYTPTLVSLEIDGLIERHPRCSSMAKHVIDDKTIAYVAPFAQHEMVYAFMEGIDPGLQTMICDSTEQLFVGVVKTIIAKVKERAPDLAGDLRKEVNPAVQKLLASLFDEWSNRRKEKHWGPVMEVASSLPKDELAGMAESLVNLTKFRYRVSPESETVGGPIDVAVITKGDGFVWVRRKHYFDPALNVRILAKHFAEVSTNGQR